MALSSVERSARYSEVVRRLKEGKLRKAEEPIPEKLPPGRYIKVGGFRIGLPGKVQRNKDEIIRRMMAGDSARQIAGEIGCDYVNLTRELKKWGRFKWVPFDKQYEERFGKNTVDDSDVGADPVRACDERAGHGTIDGPVSSTEHAGDVECAAGGVEDAGNGGESGTTGV